MSKKSGMKTKADLDNHANQMNPNNWRYEKARKNNKKGKS